MNQVAHGKTGTGFRVHTNWEMQEGKDKLNSGVHTSLCLSPNTEEPHTQILQSMSSVSNYLASANAVLLLSE